MRVACVCLPSTCLPLWCEWSGGLARARWTRSGVSLARFPRRGEDRVQQAKQAGRQAGWATLTTCLLMSLAAAVYARLRGKEASLEFGGMPPLPGRVSSPLDSPPGSMRVPEAARACLN